MQHCRAPIAVLIVLMVWSVPVCAQQGLDPAGIGAGLTEPGSGKAKKKKPAVAQNVPAKPAGAATPAGTPAIPTAGATPPAPVDVPPPEVLLMLVRTTLVALNQANYTANYAVLHGLGTPALKARNTPENLADAFKALRESKVDLSPVLVLTPQLSEPPGLGAGGVMSLRGFFPTKPLQVNFAMAFQPVEGRWLIDGLSVATVPVAGAAATPQAASAPAPAKP